MALIYAGELPIDGPGNNRWLIGRYAGIVRHLDEFWERLDRILRNVFHVQTTTTPIVTRVEDDDEYNHYADVFTFHAHLRGGVFAAELEIEYTRAVDGPYSDVPSDTLSCRLLPHAFTNVPGIAPFRAAKEGWHIMDHGTAAEQTRFLADFVGEVVARLRPLLLANRLHTAAQVFAHSSLPGVRELPALAQMKVLEALPARLDAGVRALLL